LDRSSDISGYYRPFCPGCNLLRVGLLDILGQKEYKLKILSRKGGFNGGGAK
jgi:hypothetical protein